MFGSTNTFFAGVTSTADALGNLTSTNTVTKTVAVPGFAVGYSAAVAVAHDSALTAPYTNADTSGVATGGNTTSSQTGHLSVDFPYGPTPTSVDVSFTSVSTYGHSDFLSALASSTLHGLF